MGGGGVGLPLGLGLASFGHGLGWLLGAWSLGSCSMTVGSSSRIVREAKRASDLVTGRRVRLLGLGRSSSLFFD